MSEALIAGIAVELPLDLCFGKAGEQIQQDQGAADGADRAVVFRQGCESTAEGSGKGTLFFRHKGSPRFRKDFMSTEQEGLVWENGCWQDF